MKTSAIMFIPRNIQKRKIMYITASTGTLIVVIPGRRAQLFQINKYG